MDALQRVRDSFARQQAMALVGATLAKVEPGLVEIALPYAPNITQQHGFVHAGVIAMVVDSACGYSALSMMGPGGGILSVEFKMNMLRPALGERFTARGRVVRAGRTMTVCQGEAIAHRDGKDSVVAIMQATMMRIEDREGIEN